MKQKDTQWRLQRIRSACGTTKRQKRPPASKRSERSPGSAGGGAGKSCLETEIYTRPGARLSRLLRFEQWLVFDQARRDEQRRIDAIHRVAVLLPTGKGELESRASPWRFFDPEPSSLLFHQLLCDGQP